MDDCRCLKNSVKQAFDYVLTRYNQLLRCKDSKSVLTSPPIMLGVTSYPFYVFGQPPFSIDICITSRDERDNYCRLIHEKTEFVQFDRYYWNIAPDFKNLKEKASYIKKHGKWDLVRSEYLRLKNMYLERNNYNHPSFICYAEAINNVYNQRKHW